MEGLADFLDGQQRNAWLTKNGQQVYVRKSIRMLEPYTEAVKVFDIANIETPAKKQNKGRFKQFLIDVETALEGRDFVALYVENVLTDRFAQFFRHSGWTEMPAGRFDPLILPCFYKKLGDGDGV